MPASIIVGAISSTPQGKAFLKEVTDFIANLKCRFKGSCGPKFAEIVKKTGGHIGYKRLDAQGRVYYFLNDTQYFTTQAQMETWYKASGTWKRYKDAGLEPCCLRQNFPPDEAFTVPTDGKGFGGSIELNVDGFRVLVDKNSYDPNIHKFTSGTTVSTDPAKNGGDKPQAGSNLLPLVGAYLVLKGG